MKILFQSRLDLFDKKGGDTNQMLETKDALERVGVSVDIDNTLNKNLSGYDLVHIFNLDWVCEPYLQAQNALKQGKKFILSPIHHSLKEFENYEKLERWGLARVGNAILPNQPLRDVARNLVKGIIYPKKFKPALVQLLKGIRTEQREAVKQASLVLVQTELEAKDLKLDYETVDFKWKKVINGINTKIFGNADAKKAYGKLGFEKYILCANRIEPRKNQLRLIKSFLKAKEENPILKDYKLIFCGGFNKHHPTYKKAFLELAKRNNDIKNLGFVEQSFLAHLYAGASVFAYPTWFETTGLVSIEATLCGVSSLVVSGNRVREYLGDNALYCDPSSEESISSALVEAVRRPTVKKGFADFVQKTYTWENSAKQTLEAYKEVLKS